MSGGSRLKVSLRREIELWQRPPVTAIRVLKFCRARSFCEGKQMSEVRGEKEARFPAAKLESYSPEPRGWTWWRPGLSAELCVCWGSSAGPTGTRRCTSWPTVPGQGFPSPSPARRSCGSPGTGRSDGRGQTQNGSDFKIERSSYLLKCYRSSWTPGSSGVRPSHLAPCGRRSMTPSSFSWRGTGPGRHSHAGF